MKKEVRAIVLVLLTSTFFQGCGGSKSPQSLQDIARNQSENEPTGPVDLPPNKTYSIEPGTDMLPEAMSAVHEFPTGSLIDNEKRLLVWGSLSDIDSSNKDAAIWRYVYNEALGMFTLDPTFGTNGVITWNNSAANKNDIIFTVKLNGNQLLVGGYTKAPDNYTDILMGKFDENGQPLTSFSATGFRVIDLKYTYRFLIRAATFDNSNRLLVAGHFMGHGDYMSGTSFNAFIGRATQDGSIDTTFANKGYFDYNGDLIDTNDDGVGNKQPKEYGTGIAVHLGAIYLTVLEDNGVFTRVLKLKETDGTILNTQDLPFKSYGLKIAGNHTYVYGYTCCAENDNVLAKLSRSDLAIDRSYGSESGYGLYSMFLDGDRINSRAVRVFPSYEDGQAYLVGYDFSNRPFNRTKLYKVKANGELDTTWGDQGSISYFNITSAGSSYVKSMHIEENGLIIVGETNHNIDGFEHNRIFIAYESR